VSRLGNVITLIVRKLWTVIAVTLVVFALLMSLLRYSLPYLNEKKHLLEDYAMTHYGVNLAIDRIDAQWQGSGPALVLHDVKLTQDTRSPIELSIENINVKIKFWDSVLTGQLRSQNFDLEGLNLNVNVQQIETSNNSFPIVDALENLFLEQLQLFSITNSTVSIITTNTIESVNIDALTWINKGDRHQGQGRLRVAEIQSNSASFIINLLSVDDQINGMFYAKADSLDVSPWFNEFSELKSQLKEGRGNLEIWAKIEDRKVDKINGKINPSLFIWDDNGSIYETSVDAGTFVAQPTADEWLININNLSLTVMGKQSVTNWRASVDKLNNVRLNLRDNVDISPLIAFSKVINPALGAHIETLQPTAILNNMQMAYNANTGIRAILNISDVGWQQTQTVPSLSGLNLDMFVHDQKIFARLSSDQLTLNADNLFAVQHQLDFVNVPLDFYRSDGGWFVKSQGAKLSLSGWSLQTDFLYDTHSSFLSASGYTNSLPTQDIKNYLPQSILGDGAIGFLNRAFTANGEVANAKFLWQGAVNQFPFNHNQGVFQAQVDIQAADFIFSSQWPNISNMDIRLDFQNNNLSMVAPSGKLLDVALTNVKAHIPMLSSATDLIIEAEVTSQGDAVQQLMLQSSLADTLGKTLSKDVLVSQNIDAELSLYVPLDDPVSTSVSGLVNFNNNLIHVPSLRLDLEQVVGQLRFTNDKLRSTNVSAQILGQPTKLDFNSAQVEDKYRLDVIVNGNWDSSKSASLIGEELAELVSGSFKFNAAINATLQKNEFDYAATFYSDLRGTRTHLPSPFDKVTEQAKPLKLSANGNQQASNISLSIDDDIQFDGILPHKEKQFSRAHLALGETDFMGLGVGFSISADLPNVDLNLWYQTISAISASTGSSDNAIFPLPQRIFLETNALMLAGQTLNNADLTVKREDNGWLIDVSAEQAKAEVIVYNKWIEKGIDIDADFIRLEEYVSRSVNGHKEIVPQSLPPIKFKCRQCNLFGNNFGQVKFESYPNDDGLRLDSIKFDGPHGKLDATGQWHKRNGDHYTFIDGDLDSDDFGGLLKDFKFDSGIKDSEAEIDFTFTWKDSPMDFSFKHLDGELAWQLSDGYLTELSDKGSRIFTLLSLESLVRKLSLDFRDVFAKGFFYDDMRGTVQITEGKADTRDTSIDGGAGEMEIYGYTDLVTRELNYNVNFTPNVTGNLPVLVYFMVNPPTAIAALALDQVLTSTKVISNVNYSITGTLDEPILLETGRQSTNVELPARRNIEGSEQPFIPPSLQDTLRLEVNDG